MEGTDDKSEVPDQRWQPDGSVTHVRLLKHHNMMPAISECRL